MPTRLELMVDEHEIRRARTLWAFARDLGEYDTMRECFHDDATVAVSWFDGPFLEFWEATKKLRGNLKPTERSKHWIGSYRCEVNGDRAVMETDVLLFARDDIEGKLFDYTAWMRFHDQVERRAGVWRIAKWVAIDLGRPQRFDAVRLFPARPYDWQPDTPGFLFPVRFKIEAASRADFTDARMLLDRTAGDESKPGTKAPLLRFAPSRFHKRLD